MNALGISLLWCMMQATLFTSIGGMVYFAVRRRGPAAAATAVASTLVVLAAVSALAFSPWPRWYTVGPGMSATRAEATVAGGSDADDRQGPATRAGATDGETEGPATRAGATSRIRQTKLADAWEFFWDELRLTPVADVNRSAAWRWPGVVAALFLIGVCLAVGRILLGLLAVRRYRSGMVAVTDPALLAQAARIERQMGCRRPVELRQSAALSTPATIGWRRPIVILPVDWRSWTETERQVVLAHEIAHIARGDYAAWLIAQLSVALHFYHPLVHWLARRLRLEQELAADAWAAALAGSRETYLMTLAQMALRQDDRAIAWAARGFLPTRGAFLRRIEMLSETKPLRNVSLSRGRAAGLMALVATAGLAIAGVRGPDANTRSAHAAPPEKNETVAKPRAAEASKAAFDLSYVPSRAVAVLAVRPAEIVAQPGMQPLLKLLNEAAPFGKAGLEAEKIEQFMLVLTRVPARAPAGTPGAMYDPVLQIIRYAEPFDWKSKFAPSFVSQPVEESMGGRTYYRSAHGEMAARPAFYLPDDRSIVLAPEIDLQRILISIGRKKQPEWADEWNQLATAQAVATIDLTAIRAFSKDMGDLQNPVAGAFAPIWEHGQRLFISASLNERASIAAQIRCTSEDDAKRVGETVEAVLTLARNALREADRHLAAGPAAEAAFLVPLIDMAGEALKQGKLQAEGATVEYSSTLDLDVAQTAATLLAPAVMAAREASGRVQAANNMKQIMLAMWNYADVNKHFPPPVVMGPDGKTPHSWRIEILPYIEQDALYRQYRMDEPWDSENNKKILEQMPAVLRDPNADRNSKETSYFALVGPTTFFGGKDSKGTTFGDIRDGTSNTIAIVEAKRSNPWTKPEDIEYDAAKPLPKLGGLRPGGFLAGFGDGSVHFLPDTLDEQTIRNLLTKAGGEMVPKLP